MSGRVLVGGKGPRMDANGREVAEARGILVLPTDIDQAVVKRATALGYLVIPCDDASKVSLLSGRSEVDANDVMMAALHVVQNDWTLSQGFVREFYRRLLAKEKLRASAPLRENKPEAAP